MGCGASVPQEAAAEEPEKDGASVPEETAAEHSIDYPSAEDDVTPYKATVVYNYEAKDDDQLGISVGEIVEVLVDAKGLNGWCLAKLRDQVGYIPFEHIQKIKTMAKYTLMNWPSGPELDKMNPEVVGPAFDKLMAEIEKTAYRSEMAYLDGRLVIEAKTMSKQEVISIEQRIQKLLGPKVTFSKNSMTDKHTQ